MKFHGEIFDILQCRRINIHWINLIERYFEGLIIIDLNFRFGVVWSDIDGVIDVCNLIY